MYTLHSTYFMSSTIISDHILLHSTHLVTRIVAFFKDLWLDFISLEFPRALTGRERSYLHPYCQRWYFPFFSFFCNNSGYIQLLGIKHKNNDVPTHIIFSVEATEVVLSRVSLSIYTMTRYLTKGINDAEYSNTGIPNKTITNNNNKNNNNDNSSNSNPAFDNEQKLFPLYTTHGLTFMKKHNRTILSSIYEHRITSPRVFQLYDLRNPAQNTSMMDI